jgi:hypothetical protein
MLRHTMVRRDQLNQRLTQAADRIDADRSIP